LLRLRRSGPFALIGVSAEAGAHSSGVSKAD
jgi:hypothetical protein